MNNYVEVGYNNYGNVCGGDLSINLVLPCKNGDGMLSYEDYQRKPYCNNCIGNSRVTNRRRYREYAICASSLLSVLVIGLYWLLAGHLPHYLTFLFKDHIFAELFVPLSSTLLTITFIFLICDNYFTRLVTQYNNTFFAYHK